MLPGQDQAVGEQAGVAGKRPLGRNAGQVGEIIAFRQVSEDDMGCLSVVA